MSNVLNDLLEMQAMPPMFAAEDGGAHDTKGTLSTLNGSAGEGLGASGKRGTAGGDSGAASSADEMQNFSTIL